MSEAFTTHTQKTFAPPVEFAEQAHLKSEAALLAFTETARQQTEAFWRELSRALHFVKPFDRVLEWDMPLARWFSGGKLNVSYNCLDRHLPTKSEKIALLWEGEPQKNAKPEIRKLTYKELHGLCCQIANALKNKGLKKGDRVAIYMPMVPETVATMLACARIGVIHTVVFGGFSAAAIADRVHDSNAKMIITANGTWRKAQFLNLKNIVDEALTKHKELTKSIESVLVFERDSSEPYTLEKGRDYSWKESVLSQKKECVPESLDSEDPLFILYTSGTTGKPKGLYHTQAGYLLWAHWTSRWLFDLKDSDLFWCTADCGWITGHTYVTYGPLSNGASVFMYEGSPLHPGPNRYWDMIERHKVTTLYTAPTAIRMFMRFGEEPIKKHNLKSLRLLGSVGEPLNPEAWHWYYEHVGGERCPIVDTWWQTETGGAMIAPFPGASTLKPGSVSRPLPGIESAVVNSETGVACKTGEKGVLVVKRPWPSLARGIWGDPERYKKTYWDTKPALSGIYVAADAAYVDEDGDYWIVGRMDDVLKVSGHRIGSAEIESALVSHPDVSEAAAVGVPDAVKGESIACFVTLNIHSDELVSAGGPTRLAQLKKSLSEHVVKEIGPLARPEQIRLAHALPKTRSGKIMRRLLRELAATGEIHGDTSTLEDFSPQAALEKEEV